MNAIQRAFALGNSINRMDAAWAAAATPEGRELLAPALEREKDEAVREALRYFISMN